MVLSARFSVLSGSDCGSRRFDLEPVGAELGRPSRSIPLYGSGEELPLSSRGCCLPDGYGTSGFEKQVGYHGEIAIDPASGAILRLQAEADLEGFPPVSRLRHHDHVRPGGDRREDLYLPAEKRLHYEEPVSEHADGWDEGFRTYGPYQTMVNDITYGDYHMSRAESRLLPGFNPDVSESSPGSGDSRK